MFKNCSIHSQIMKLKEAEETSRLTSLQDPLRSFVGSSVCCRHSDDKSGHGDRKRSGPNKANTSFWNIHDTNRERSFCGQRGHYSFQSCQRASMMVCHMYEMTSERCDFWLDQLKMCVTSKASHPQRRGSAENVPVWDICWKCLNIHNVLEFVWAFGSII